MEAMDRLAALVAWVSGALLAGGAALVGLAALLRRGR